MTYQSLLGNIAGKEQLINLQIRSLHGNLLYYKKLNSRPFLANVHDKVLKQTFRPLFFRHFKVFVCDTLHNLENVKNTHGGILLLLKLQASAFLHRCVSRF